MKKNKKLILLLLATCVFASVHAQIQFGIKGGPNFYSFNGSDVPGAKLRIGFNAGALVKIPFNDQFSLQPEVQYSGQGAKGSDYTGNYTYTNNNLNIPLLFTFTHSSGLIIQTGPQFGFLLSSNGKENGVSADTKQAFKSTDFGWTTGLGWLSPANIGFIARYSAGWLNIENRNYTQGTGSIRNIGFQIGAFYLFGDSGRD